MELTSRWTDAGCPGYLGGRIWCNRESAVVSNRGRWGRGRSRYLGRKIRYRKRLKHVEDHCSLGGSIISRLYNGAFVGLIYELLVFS